MNNKGCKHLREKVLVGLISLILLVELIIIFPNLSSIKSKDIQTIENLDNKLSHLYANKLLSNTSFAFTENRGHLENDDVRFYSQDGRIWFTNDGVWFEIREEIKLESRES